MLERLMFRKINFQKKLPKGLHNSKNVCTFANEMREEPHQIRLFNP